MIVQRDTNLLQIIAAAGSPGRFAGGLHRGQEKGHEHADDGDDNEQLDERKTATL
jgi:hypothetical protein